MTFPLLVILLWQLPMTPLSLLTSLTFELILLPSYANLSSEALISADKRITELARLSETFLRLLQVLMISLILFSV